VRRSAADLPDPTEVVFTAHSLPTRILDEGDPYPDQLRETADAVASRAGVAGWRIGWQSAGRTPEPWIGPDIREVLDEPAASRSRRIRSRGVRARRRQGAHERARRHPSRRRSRHLPRPRAVGHGAVPRTRARRRPHRPGDVEGVALEQGRGSTAAAWTGARG